MAKSADGFGLVKWLIIIAIVGGVTAVGIPTILVDLVRVLIPTFGVHIVNVSEQSLLAVAPPGR